MLYEISDNIPVIQYCKMCSISILEHYISAYGGQPPPPAGYAQPAPGANGYPQWGGQPPTPTQQQPPAVAPPQQQPPAQPGYPGYAPQPATAPGNPPYGAPGQPGTPQGAAPPPRPYGDYGMYSDRKKIPDLLGDL